MIDFHCHLDLYADPHGVAAECARRNLHVLSVTTTPRAWEGTKALEGGSKRIYTALGLHPELAGTRKQELELFEELLPTTRFVGEVGLDGAPALRPSWRDQSTVFRRILIASDRLGGRVMSIHSRRATAAVLEHLSRDVGKSMPVLHWFSGTRNELRQAVELGCWFSVGLPMLNSAKGRMLVGAMPQRRVLPETDGPFVQHNEQPAMPWDVDSVAEELVRLWATPRANVDEILERNLSELMQTTARA